MQQALPNTSLDRLEARAPVLVKKAAIVLDVVRQMKVADQGAVLVVDDDGRLIGILTERDLVRAAVETGGDAWQRDSVERWMRPDPVSLVSTDAIATVIHRMNTDRFRRLPVLDEGGRPVGLVSIRDVLAYVADSFPGEFANLPPDPEHEAKHRWGG